MSTSLLDDKELQEEAAAAETPELIAVLAEFTTVDTVIAAARRLRIAGFTRWDTHSPFPLHGIDRAMGIRPTILPWMVLCGGLFGLFGALWLTWYTNAHDYPFLISGKPVWSLPANIPIIFECTILCSALTAVFGMLGLNRLPLLYNPLFKSERFRRVTNDRFFIVIDVTDPKFDLIKTPYALRALGAVAVEKVED